MYKLPHNDDIRFADGRSRVDDIRLIEHDIVEMLHASAGIHVLTQLVAIDPHSLGKSARVDYLAALEKQSGWLQALMQEAIVAVAGTEASLSNGLWGGVDDFEREEISSALRLSASTAQSRIDIARTLVNHLPATCSALATGEISAAHATVIARESANAISQGLSANSIATLEAKAIAHAEFHTPIQVANKVRGTIAQLAPQEFETATEIARDCRNVVMYPEKDGMATIVALLPAADAQTIMLAIDALARFNSGGDSNFYTTSQNAATPQNSAASQEKGNNRARTTGSDHDVFAEIDQRNMDMKRADALTTLASTALASISEDYKPQRRPVTVNLTIDLPTLLGLDENPGHLVGYGPIPASVARELAADGKWKRFITDPVTGNLLDYGREHYQPPQALVDFLTARDRTCRFPGCRQPARISDLDHAQSWEDGGSTSPDNLGVLCRRHHQLKTHGGWKLLSRHDGSCHWTSPLGKEYEVPARPISETT